MRENCWRGLVAGLLLCSAVALAGDAPKLDAAKYPQDTPEHALQSLSKALEDKDFGYWITNLMTPFDSKSFTDRYGSLDKAVEFFSDEKRAGQLKHSGDLMKKMLDANKSTSGEAVGIKYTRFQGDDRSLQLEQQPDGRWCMNMRYNGPKAPPPPAK